MPSSKRDTENAAAPDRAGPRTPDLDGLDARPFGRKRLMTADPGEWSGTAESDTITETEVQVALPAGLRAGDSDFTDEDTFTDRDIQADAREPAGRDTLLELTPRDTLLDLSAAARAASAGSSDADAEHFSGDRTLDDDSPFAGDDTFDEPTGK